MVLNSVSGLVPLCASKLFDKKDPCYLYFTTGKTDIYGLTQVTHPRGEPVAELGPDP